VIAARLALLALLGMPAAVPTSAQERATPALANPVAALLLEQLSATRERPLFSPARRLPAAPEPEPPPPVAAAPEPRAPVPVLALFGIVADQDGARAIVRAGASSGILRLRVGDTIEGWTVADIGRRDVTLRLGDRSESFGLFAGDRKAVAAPRVVPPKMAVAPVARSTPKNFESDGL
jgi:hypothetical protein